MSPTTTLPQRLMKEAVSVGLPALTVALGVQSLRTFLPLLVFLLRDRMGWTAAQLGIYAALVLAVSFLAAPLWRLLGIRRSLLATAGALGVLRLTMQLWWGDPLVLLVLATLATLAFVLFLPTYLMVARPGGSAATGRYGIAILLGIVADVALHGALTTWDLAWRREIWAVATVAVLVGLQLLLLVLYLRGSREPGGRLRAATGAVAVPWIGMGPVLALTLLVFANVARAAALSGWRSPAAFAAVMVAQAAGVTAATLALSPGGLALERRAPSTAALIAGIVLAACVAVTPSGGLLTLCTLVVGQITMAWLFATALWGLGVPGDRARPGRISAAGGAGMLVLLAVLFLTYAGYDVALPLPPEALLPLAAAVLALAAIPSLRRVTHSAAVDVTTGWGPASAGLALLAVPAIMLVFDHPADTQQASGDLRVMTYNIHNGFDTAGRLDLEATARTIEEQDPDVVALQEVARGWVVDGSADTLEWLARRLHMGVVVYGPTSGPQWGNALLSRVPVAAAETHPLPPEDLLLQRGYTRAEVQGPEGSGPITVFATHYHHPDDGSAVRVEQSRVLLDAWGGAPRTVIMGDLNAEPGAPEVELLRGGGFVEAIDAAGLLPGYTYSSDDPHRRIDYIWVSSDLAVGRPAGGSPVGAADSSGATASSERSALTDVVITTGNASDHLGVAATIAP